jgi:carboxyl-terminal processing protease
MDPSPRLYFGAFILCARLIIWYPPAYLYFSLDVIQGKAYYRERVDWKAVRAHAFKLAQGARCPADTYSAIRFALDALGDHHSMLIDASVLQEAKAHHFTQWNAVPSVRTLGARIGYIELPSVLGEGALPEVGPTSAWWARV